MDYLLVFLSTIISCLLFDRSGVVPAVNSLKRSYRVQFGVMRDETISDETKQKLLLRQTRIQMILLGKLILGLLLFLTPFLLLILLDPLIDFFSAQLLYTGVGLGISLLAVLAYIIFRKKYGNLFKSR